MTTNSLNSEIDNEQNEHGLKKITYLEKYGVKCVPYPGRRRFKPLVYQSEDGGIIISNEVFGLSIRQFDRVYKACLVRRKAQEQYILNLRYPDKTSDEYLKYLDTDCNKENRSRNTHDLKGKYLHECLVKTLGTEIDIRKKTTAIHYERYGK